MNSAKFPNVGQPFGTPQIPADATAGVEPTQQGDKTSAKNVTFSDVVAEPGEGAKVVIPKDAASMSLQEIAVARKKGKVDQRNRQQLTDAATKAAAEVAGDHPPGATVTGEHPALQAFGKGLGMTLGVIVTEALAFVPSWNTPVLDAQGKPVDHVDGATRIGNHDILKRHQEVVGPKIAAYVKTLPAGVVHELLEGLGKGATDAPGTSYRLEAKISDLF